MVNIDVNKVLGEENNYYGFVMAVAKRAREISDTQFKNTREYIEADKTKTNTLDKMRQIPQEYLVKPVRLAIEEFRDGKCYMVEPEEEIEE